MHSHVYLVLSWDTPWWTGCSTKQEKTETAAWFGTGLYKCSETPDTRTHQTYKNFFQSGNKQIGCFCHLPEGESSDWATPLMQSQSFTVAVSGDVTFGQNHTAVCEACRETKHDAEKDC